MTKLTRAEAENLRTAIDKTDEAVRLLYDALEAAEDIRTDTGFLVDGIRLGLNAVLTGQGNGKAALDGTLEPPRPRNELKEQVTDIANIARSLKLDKAHQWIKQQRATSGV